MNPYKRKQKLKDVWLEGWTDAVFTAHRVLPMTSHEQKARVCFSGDFQDAYNEGCKAGMNAWQMATDGATAHTEPKN